jgi:serine/threonine protein kinase
VTSRPSLRDALVGTFLEGRSGRTYLLTAFMNEGGQGWIYRAAQAGTQTSGGAPPSLKRTTARLRVTQLAEEGPACVVKILRPEGSSHDALERFEREIRVLQLLGSEGATNPHIVRYDDHGVVTTRLGGSPRDLPFLVVELVEGTTLADALQASQSRGLELDRVVRLMGQVAGALEEVHKHRIVHRDLKPSNILITRRAEKEIAKVTDFGLVKAPGISTRNTATVAGASVGYAPPEQYEMGNARVSPQTDVFSFAAILFETVSGESAFPSAPGDGPLRVVARMMSGDRPSLASLGPRLRSELRTAPDAVAVLDSALARSLAANPDERHPSVSALWSAVEPALRRLSTREATTSSGTATSSMSTQTAIWRFTRHAAPMTRDRLKNVLFLPHEGLAFGMSLRGLHRYRDGAWERLATPSELEPERVRGLALTGLGELVVYGERGLAAVLDGSGRLRALPGDHGDCNWLGASWADGELLLAGENRATGCGAIADIGATRANVRPVPGTTRLFGAARVDGGVLVACGSYGDLVQIAAGAPREVPWGRTGHLYAIARGPGGVAFAVGSGGHALAIARIGADGEGLERRASLEAVQTTRDLWCVRVDPLGAAWAAGSEARVLERRGGVWTRIAVDVSTSHVVGLEPLGDRVLLGFEDGSIVEGQLRV